MINDTPEQIYEVTCYFRYNDTTGDEHVEDTISYYICATNRPHAIKKAFLQLNSNFEDITMTGAEAVLIHTQHI